MARKRRRTLLTEEERRFGRPRTDAERRRRHFALFDSRRLPPRGTRLGRR